MLRVNRFQGVALVVGLGLGTVGMLYLVDGLQPGAEGGRGAPDPETGLYDPSRDGGDGEAGSTFDVGLGTSLLAAGLLVGAAGYRALRSRTPAS